MVVHGTVVAGGIPGTRILGSRTIGIVVAGAGAAIRVRIGCTEDFATRSGAVAEVSMVARFAFLGRRTARGTARLWVRGLAWFLC